MLLTRRKSENRARPNFLKDMIVYAVLVLHSAGNFTFEGCF